MTRIADDSSPSPVVIIEKSDGGLAAFALGAMAGAALALLWAPRTGEDTRRVLKNKGRELVTAAEETAEQLQEIWSGGVERTKAKIEEGVVSAREAVDEKRTAATDALDAGKAAVHSARGELERRLAKARSARTKARKAEADEPAV